MGTDPYGHLSFGPEIATRFDWPERRIPREYYGNASRIREMTDTGISTPGSCAAAKHAIERRQRQFAGEDNALDPLIPEKRLQLVSFVDGTNKNRHDRDTFAHSAQNLGESGKRIVAVRLPAKKGTGQDESGVVESVHIHQCKAALPSAGVGYTHGTGCRSETGSPATWETRSLK